MFDTLTLQIEDIIKPFVEDRLLELVEISVKPRNKSVMIQILADHPKGGITVDECAAINRYLVGEIDQRQLVNDYTVEVSSPGLDRPLKTTKDFFRVVGREVRFHLLEPVEDKREYAGIIQEIQDSCVVVRLTQGTIVIPLEKIGKATQIVKT